LNSHPIDQLALFDPKLAQSLTEMKNLLDLPQLQKIVEMTLWSFNIEIQLGYLVFKGFEKIISAKVADSIDTFIEQVKIYANKGTSLGLLIADHLPLILIQKNSELSSQFFFTLDTLFEIGLYILHRPLQSFKKILESGDLAGSLAMLELFLNSFSKELDFHQSKNLTQYLPQICESLQPEKRAFQIRQLIRVAQIDIQWIYACEKGFNNGLQSLHSQALETYIQTGIEKYESQPEKGILYFSIADEIARNVFESLQTVYPLRLIHERLTNYIHARIGLFVSIRSFSQLPKQFQLSKQAFYIYNDSLCIYVPDEIGIFANKNDNRLLYKYLIRWEASFFEWGTYDFDLEKLIDMYPDIDLHNVSIKGTDLYRYLNSFPNLRLAKNLFILFEHLRIRSCLNRFYPGVLRVCLPVFRSLIKKNNKNISVLQQLYNAVVLDLERENKDISLFNQIKLAMKRLNDQTATVETSAHLTFLFYSDIHSKLDNFDMNIPVSDICCELIEKRIYDIDQKAKKLCTALRQKKIKIYKSQIRKKLYQKNELSMNDLQELVAFTSDANSIQQCLMSLNDIENRNEILSEPQGKGSVFHYNEWDSRIGSYKINYTRVVQTEYAQTPNTCYEQSLQANFGLLRHIRRRFEMLRPEGLKILRRWQEGDAFDYRQLLEYGIDRKMRKTPSDRLYTKRVKEYRDVAVFLLVDLSKSTANVLPGSRKTVLDVEQDAIVIFCEALKQCGDPFAIAGFSSVGRHAVSFYWIKQINEDLSHPVKNRIGNMRSLRSTRLGTAIRHVNYQVENIPSKIRLVIVLSDGFPNDSDYKKEYAIKDTRKAILEARSKGIYIHGITVNLSVNAQLDDLYGKGNHHVITDVSELPDRLPIIYHQLTKRY
jgi:hypothetical protein